MAATSPQEVTGLLLAWSEGEQAALANLTPLVYAELRRVAHRYMGRERPGHSLQTTALVNEAYLRLIDARRCAGRIVPTSSPFPRNRCGGFWSILPGRGSTSNEAAEP